jgi:sirohydrochlorin ferrochelatase
MTGYIVFAHGSSVEPANEAVRKVAREAAARGRWTLFETAFLGGGRPTLKEAVDRLVSKGASDITVIPYFLTTGIHLDRDLPELIGQIRAEHRGVNVVTTAPLDGHPGLLEAVLDRAMGIEK